MADEQLIALNKLGEIRNQDPTLYQVIQEIQQQLNAYIMRVAGRGGAPVRLTTTKGLTGTIDGINAAFTTSAPASIASQFLAIVDGIVDLGATWAGSTLTSSSPPISGIALLYWA